jgi:hypothetical protein
MGGRDVRMILKGAATAMLLSAATPVLACDGMPPVPAAAATQTPATVTAAELAQAYIPRDMLMAQMGQNVQRGFVDAFDADPRMRMMMERDPQLFQRVIAITQAVMQECISQFIEGAQVDAARIFAAQVPVAQMRDIMAFYRTSAGQRLLVSAMNPQGGELTPELGPDGRPLPITMAQFRAHMRRPVRNALSELTPAELETLNSFGASPAGQSFIRVGTPLSNALLTRTNATVAALQPLLVRRLQQELGRPPAR